VDAIAARAKSGRLWLALTNVDPNLEVRVEVTAAGVMQAAGEVLSSPRIDSVNTFESPATVIPRPLSERASGGKVTLNLAPHSVAVVELESNP
jgi:alpha-N-arabinofuranosidase